MGYRTNGGYGHFRTKVGTMMMNVRDFECRSYEAAKELLGGKTWRRVCNNTTIRNTGSTINVELHGAIVVMHYKDGRALVTSAGYRTTTTKDRINRCLPEPWRLAQRRGNWHLWRTAHMEYDRRTEEQVPFVDGMMVPGTGIGTKKDEHSEVTAS